MSSAMPPATAMSSRGVSSKIWFASMRMAWIVVRTDSMAVMVFCPKLATSTTASWAWTTGVHSTIRHRLRLSRRNIGVSFLHRDTLAILEFLRTAIDAVEGLGIPVGQVSTARQQQAEGEREDAQDVMHDIPPFRNERYCHMAGRCKGCVSRTLQICPASTSMVGRVSRARPRRGLRA